jgi:hypothetical protein
MKSTFGWRGTIPAIGNAKTLTVSSYQLAIPHDPKARELNLVCGILMGNDETLPAAAARSA